MKNLPELEHQFTTESHPQRRSLVLMASLPFLSLLPTACTSLSSKPVYVPPPDLDVPFVTTPDNVVVAMLELAKTTGKDFVLDLGSGDGRIPITAALRYGARGMGVEIDPRLVIDSQDNARKAGVTDKVRFVEQDLFKTDLGVASVITMYLLPDVNLLLRPHLQKLRPGTRIVSHDWDMGDWPADTTQIVPAPNKKIGSRKEAKLMLWVVR